MQNSTPQTVHSTNLLWKFIFKSVFFLPDMALIILFFISFVFVASTNSIPSSVETIENSFEKELRFDPKAYYGQGVSSPLVGKVNCAMDINGAVTAEFGAQTLWAESQAKMLRNTNSLFACMKNEGFAATA